MNKRTFPFYRTALLFSFSILLGIYSFAQSISVPGFYITPQGDTVRGTFPNYKQWSRNPEKISFIAHASSQTIELTPANSRKLVIENQDEYIAYAGQRMTNPIDDEFIVSNGFLTHEDQYAEVTTFLRLVAKAAGTELYLLSDNYRINFFYRQAGDTLTELKYKKYLLNNQMVRVSVYQRQLLTLFPKEIEERKLATSVEKLDYSEEHMTRFFKKLDPAAHSRKRTKNPAAGWVISAGISVNNLKATGDNRIEQTRTSYNTSVSPVFSVGYMLPLNRNFGRYFFYYQTRLFRYSNSGELKTGTNTVTTTFQAALAATGELNAGAHLINRQNRKLHLSGGFGMVFFMDHKVTEKNRHTSTNTLYSSEIGLRKMTHIGNLSTGVLLNNKVLLQATYNIPMNVGGFVFYSPVYSSLQFRVGYKLK